VPAAPGRPGQLGALESLYTLRSPHPTLIGERFKVVNGKVKEIEAFFSIPAGSLPICDVVAELCP
jgi:hypothetical protein